MDHLREQIKTDAELFTKRAPEIAEMILNYPLQPLRKYIYDCKLDGEMLCNNPEYQDFSWIQNISGWNDDEITQIKEDIQKKLESKLNAKFEDSIATSAVLQLKIQNGITVR